MASSIKRTQLTYDVYLSFRGQDTRLNFVSHLYQALISQGVSVFADDSLIRGDLKMEITRRIEESKMFVIIFSRNYASSMWCLDELVHIMELWETKERLVLPVFYHVDPSDVGEQSGRFKVAFDQHNIGGVDHGKLLSWRRALMLATEISGWYSGGFSDDANLIKAVVGEIWRRLDRPSKSSFADSGAVQSNLHIANIRSLLQLSLPDIRSVVVVGEGGIGKTTIVKQLFPQICNLFQRFYLFTNVKEEVKQGVVNHLRGKLRLGSLGEETLDMATLSFRHAFNNNQTRRSKILLILEDVDDSKEIQELIDDRDKLFGSGSRILITSRKISVLQNVDEIYEVERMNDEDAEELFSSFSSTESFKFLEYANGNPLAIKVLSSALREKSDSELDSALEKLEKPPIGVDKVLRYSYNTLKEDEKKVFLDIACFFVGESLNYITEELDSHYPSVHVILRTLKDRCLISIPNENLEMHDLLQEMAWTIVREELSVELGKRSKLWNPENLYKLLDQQKGWMMLGCSSSLCFISL